MRWLAVVFAALIVAMQYPMWFGKGGWREVRELDRRVTAQRETNAELKARNDALDADVRDLKAGYEAIEERARAELGMVKPDEVLFLMQPAAVARGNPVPLQAAAAPGTKAANAAPARSSAPRADKR